MVLMALKEIRPGNEVYTSVILVVGVEGWGGGGGKKKLPMAKTLKANFIALTE